MEVEIIDDNQQADVSAVLKAVVHELDGRDYIDGQWHCQRFKSAPNLLQLRQLLKKAEQTRMIKKQTRLIRQHN